MRRSAGSDAKSNASASATCNVSCAARELLAQARRQIAIDFDGRDVSRALDQPAGDRGQARTDLDHVLPGPRIDGVDDARRVVRVGEEVLAESLAGDVAIA